MELDSKILVAGEETLLGRALTERLKASGYRRLVTNNSGQPDFTDGRVTEEFFERHRPEYVFITGGKSGGIKANQKYPADLMLDNLLVQCFLMRAAVQSGTRKLLYVGSSCMYPRGCVQPMPVDALMTDRLEPTNEAYALSKLAGLVLCQSYRRQYGVDFVAAIPANPFGPGDDFSVEDSHVVAALIRRFHEAKIAGAPAVRIWGSGRARREFIFVEDLADACVFVMKNYSAEEPINIGVGADISIRELAEKIQAVTEYQGSIVFDSSCPDGMPAKLLDSCRLASSGWRPHTPFEVALRSTYAWFLESYAQRGNDQAVL